MIESVQEQELVLTSNTSPITFADTDLRTASANCFNGWFYQWNRYIKFSL